ncbi:hypothetical protein LCGC14_0394360 [marine sediment metagenome]|uniref:Uncharacterized protein n=1 Tax=marine sediment metagenome TaxID=412755 RepID=A0A0F9VKR6_9ZZZZ
MMNKAIALCSVFLLVNGIMLFFQWLFYSRGALDEWQTWPQEWAGFFALLLIALCLIRHKMERREP